MKKFVLEHKQLMEDKFNSLTEEEKEFVMEIVACFMYRTGKKQHDGSLGEIEITPKELNDALAYAINYADPKNWKLVNSKICY